MNNYSKLVSEELEGMEEVNIEALLVFRENVIKTLALIDEKLKSEDPLEREEALLQAREIKALLEKQVKSLYPAPKKKKTNPIHLVG